MDAQILADLIAGSSSNAQLLEIIASLQKMGDLSGHPTDLQNCANCIAVLKQGYKNWTGETLA